MEVVKDQEIFDKLNDLNAAFKQSCKLHGVQSQKELIDYFIEYNFLNTALTFRRIEKLESRVRQLEAAGAKY